MFSHVTAAQLWGLPLARSPRGPGRARRHPPDDPRPHRATWVHQPPRLRAASDRDGRTACGVTDLADTWVDLGEVMSRGLEADDLVIAGDVVANRLPRRSRSHEVLDARVRPRHGRSLTVALGLVRAGVRSPMETRATTGVPPGRVPRARGQRRHPRQRRRMARGGRPRSWRAPDASIGEYQGAVHAGIRNRSLRRLPQRVAGGRGVDGCWRSSPRTWPTAHATRADLLTRFARALALDPEGARTSGEPRPREEATRRRPPRAGSCVLPPLDAEGRARVTRRGVRGQA